ncbi:MAG: GNAT family N-acetyltransferase [Gammaproteobacteria bacterium]|nr:GNAT family N-acetyltransferase [Gammaproteobacteria bacterium]
MNHATLQADPALRLHDGSLAPLRPARPADDAAMAFFAAEASEGMAPWFWSQNDQGLATLEEGARRARREDADFSYRNAWMVEAPGDSPGEAVAMLLGFMIEPADIELDDLPPLVRPLVELEQRAAGSWYINIVATRPEWRGHGLGTGLLAYAHALAMLKGCEEVSLQNFESNAAARRLYERFGFVERARLPMPAPPQGSRVPHFGASILHVMRTREELAAPFLR